MTEPTAAQLDRIARLRRRRAVSNADAAQTALPRPDATLSAPAASAPRPPATSAELTPPASTQPASAAPAAPTPRRRRRRHAASGSRIVAAGFGAGTMFGIVTLLGLNNPVSQAEAPVLEPPTPQAPVAPTPAVAPSVEVRVHVIPASTGTAPATAATQLDPETVGGPDTLTIPIELTANPVVRTVTVAAPTPVQTQTASAPQPPQVATTNGSG